MRGFLESGKGTFIYLSNAVQDTDVKSLAEGRSHEGRQQNLNLGLYHPTKVLGQTAC